MEKARQSAGEDALRGSQKKFSDWQRSQRIFKDTVFKIEPKVIYIVLRKLLSKAQPPSLQKRIVKYTTLLNAFYGCECVCRPNSWKRLNRHIWIGVRG